MTISIKSLLLAMRALCQISAPVYATQELTQQSYQTTDTAAKTAIQYNVDHSDRNSILWLKVKRIC